MINLINRYNKLSEKNKTDTDRYDEIWKSMNDINRAITDINHNNELIKSYTDSLEDLERDRSNVEHSIRSLEEYKIELDAYTE